MGFRFQRRIRLGRGFGLNISKSGITPSHRSRRGSISSKGFSIRTGIPGLQFRKRFSKGGCMWAVLMIVFLSLSFSFTSCSSSSEEEDYEEIVSRCGTYQGNQLYTGPQGGCYYINSNDNKIYVDRSLCNC